MDETRVDASHPWTSPAGRPMVNAAEESDRLRQVEALGIAVDRPDDSLQEVVDRIADIYRVGLCSVNLMLRDRQIFKTWAGDLPEELAAMRQLDRQKSLCTYVVASHVPLVIEDMPAREEWREQYFHAEHGVRFYAGVPQTLNDSMGHAVGDLCLQQVATALSEQIRPRDSRFLFRLGGDEFALALPVPESAHPEMGSRLESAVSRLAAEAYPTVDLHLDLGEAEVPQEAASLQEALKLADARMYEAKRARRSVL